MFRLGEELIGIARGVELIEDRVAVDLDTQVLAVVIERGLHHHFSL